MIMHALGRDFEPSSPPNLFFVPASQRPQQSRPARDYNHMENGGGIDPLSANTSANIAASTSAASSPSPDGLEDTIVDDTAPPWP